MHACRPPELDDGGGAAAAEELFGEEGAELASLVPLMTFPPRPGGRQNIVFRWNGGGDGRVLGLTRMHSPASKVGSPGGFPIARVPKEA
jgi:hypothetical protein